MPDRDQTNASTRITRDNRPTEAKPPEDDLMPTDDTVFEVGLEPIRADFDSSGNAVGVVDAESMARANGAREQEYEPPYESSAMPFGQRAEDPRADRGHKTGDPTDALVEDEEAA